MKILRSQVHVGDIIDNSSIVTYIGKYDFSTFDFTTNTQHGNLFNSNFNQSNYLNITRTGLTTIEQIASHYPEFFI